MDDGGVGSAVLGDVGNVPVTRLGHVGVVETAALSDDRVVAAAGLGEPRFIVGTALVDERDVAISGLIDIHRVVELLVEVAVQCCATGLVDNRLVVIARRADEMGSQSVMESGCQYVKRSVVAAS